MIQNIIPTDKTSIASERETVHSEKKEMLVMKPRMTSDEFLHLVANKLSRCNVEEQFLDSIDTQNVKIKYLCYHRIKGTADCHWTSRTRNDEVVEYNKRVITIKSGAPVSGCLKNLEFETLIPTSHVTTAEWAKEAEIITSEEEFYSKSDIADSDIYGNLNADSELLWKQASNEITTYCLVDKVVEKAQNACVLFDYAGIIPEEEAKEYETRHVGMCDWNISSENYQLESAKKVLVPFFVLEVNYKDKQYFFSVLANDSKELKVSLPQNYHNIEYLMAVEKFSMEKKKKSLIVISCIIAVFFCFFCSEFKNTTISLIVVVLFIVSLFTIYYLKFDKPLSDKRKELIKESEESQRRIEEKLLRKFALKG